MAERQNGYRQFERFLTILLALTGAMFVLFLFTSGLGLVVLKCLLALIVAALAGIGLFLLYRTKELLHSRSLYLTLSYSALILLTIVSLICNYPAP